MPSHAHDAHGAAMRARVVDFHSHVIPGVDDGARDLAESRAALRSMRSSGVMELIATPHVDGSIAGHSERFGSRMRELDGGWQTLCTMAASDFPDMQVHRGAEVKLDTPEPDLTDSRMRLAGGRFVLVEFPYFTIPPRSARVLAYIRECNWIPIVAHPERYDGVLDDTEILQRWKAAGAYLQVNGPSLLGRYGSQAKAAAGMLLENGWADYLSSDYHARGRTEVLTYRDSMIDMEAETQVELLMWVNPMRMLQGEEPLPVPPLPEKRGIWDRISAAFR